MSDRRSFQAGSFCCLLLAACGASPILGEPPPIELAVPILSDADAWRHLPPAEKGSAQPLPVWARALAAPLPYTTAAMLELDFEHRSRNPLPARLAAHIRWIVSDANHCDYGRQRAVADFRRAGGRDAELHDIESLPERDRNALAFARRLTVAGYTVTDAEVARLIEWHGDKALVAMVLGVAYSNFLDRLVLSLDLSPLEADFEPLAVRFAPRPLGASREAPRSKPLRQPDKGSIRLPLIDPEWRTLDFATLQRELALQRSRRPRVTLPDGTGTSIHWGLVCRAYQPELAAVWTACNEAFGAEASQDKVLDASLLWVVTRTQQTFYCMGHCEMLLAVAGFDKSAVANHTRHLAEGDWSNFEPGQQAALLFARRMGNPARAKEHFTELVTQIGRERAIDVLWWTCHGHYLTRVASAFQLPLERGNVFDGFLP